MGLLNWLRNGSSTAGERAAEYACDRRHAQSARAYFRAIGVKASPELTFRWLCQLTQAPYSYDLIDNRGHRSPRELTPGADQIEVGSEFLICEVTDIEPGHQITGIAPEEVERVFGPISATYSVVADEAGGSRFVVKLWLGANGRAGRLKRAALVFGDAIMMRKQLNTLRDLAERDQRRADAA